MLLSTLRATAIKSKISKQEINIQFDYCAVAPFKESNFEHSDNDIVNNMLISHYQMARIFAANYLTFYVTYFKALQLEENRVNYLEKSTTKNLSNHLKSFLTIFLMFFWSTSHSISANQRILLSASQTSSNIIISI